ncbi:hypothetical protein [Chryseobacterium sp. PET-29]|uniref:hypothetical protein n=1 Tax=Chryseobacterium sp. PET-29 TaxID=2983267 RepID=UPI0021E60E03|nr:hypothetical protein [Chryseobacterium sp. PET-29]
MVSEVLLVKDISQEVIGKLNANDNETLLSLLEKELIKYPENASIHKVFIEMMVQNVAGVI